MSNNILITGGAGFIGSNLALKLLDKGYTVTVLDNLSPQIHGEDGTKSELFLKIRDKVNFINGDVINNEDWRQALKGIDVVVHLAAETGTGQSMYEINKYIDVNVKGTSNLLHILTNEEHQVKKIVIAASRAIYGEGMYHCSEHGTVYPVARTEADMSKADFEVKCPICNCNVELMATTEETKIHPTSIYGITKQMQEDMCMVVGKSINIPVVGYRYQNVYGPGQSLKNPYTGILSIFSTIIKNGNNINIFEDGKESRDFVYIDDIVDATILGIEKEEANFESFNVGTGVCTNVLEVATLLKKKYQSDTEIEISGNYRLGDIRHNYADLTKIHDKLGFSPKVSFEEGITKFVDWVNQQEVVEDNYQKSIEEMKKKGLYK
ncbi:SDR family NAD(P)-dependent oxidoreductase [Bacillus sp. DJP31]|uniref:SDR family NAD(P)-dependent oxidoreductase n=1 Tax=Bacillus sp. DJP31 TaxID=3409789 RepID=UPI003BB74A1E